MASLYSPDIEQHLLGLIFVHPDLWGDLSLLNRDDFSPVRQRVFDILKTQLDSAQPITPIILVEKLKSYGQSAIDVGGVDLLTYLDGLVNLGKIIERKDAPNLLRELKLFTVKRELVVKCDEAKKAVINGKTFDQIVSATDQALSSITTQFFKTDDTQEMFASLIDKVEALGNNPLDPKDMGYGGVFPSIERTIGALIGRGYFVNVTARQSVGKSSFAFFYAAMTAEKHNLPILWVDAGEMTMEQLQFRAVCCLSAGRVPLWAVRSGKWRQNKDWERIIRQDVWPRVRKLKLYHRSVSGLSPKEKVAMMRRFYFNKIGRGNFLHIVDDYLKGVENLTKDSTEWQGVGYYVADVKSLVTEEIEASFWTSTQANRLGIVKGKKAADLVDNDSVVSLSDRINHNATHSLLLRQKVPEELAREKNSYGNMLAKVLKIRDGLGMEYEAFCQPIKVGATYADNYFNIDYHGFHYTDKGLYSEMLANLGHTAVDLSSKQPGEQMP